VCDLETSRMGAPYIYDISRLRVKCGLFMDCLCAAVPCPVQRFEVHRTR